MIENEQPSRTALAAAAARAAHLMVDDPPLIFADTLAAPLLGAMAEELTGYHRFHGTHPVLVGARTTVITRSRYTEDRLAECGATQYVVLGAGLDTYSYRCLDPAMRVFEVDHPATQRWKRRLLTEAGIPVPGTLTYVPVDFETDSLAARLADHGFDPSVPALVGWLGVIMYLTSEGIRRTLGELSRFTPGTELVIDYMLPAELRDPEGQAYVDAVMPMAAEHGEPWLTFFSPTSMAALLAEQGFDVIEQVGQRDAVDDALWVRSDALRPYRLSMLVHARVT